MEQKPEKIPELTDMETVLNICNHIINPCGPGDGTNLEEFYLKEAERLLKNNKITDTEAKKTLESVLEIYRRKTKD